MDTEKKLSSGKQHNFTKDLRDGKKAEEELHTYFVKECLWGNATRTQGNDSRYDIEVPGIDLGSNAPLRFEVKWDKYSSISNRIAIEIGKRNPSNPKELTEFSGIMTSQADYWAILARGDWYIAPRLSLREYAFKMNLEQPKLFPSLWAGDGRRARNILVPLEYITKQDFFTPIALESRICEGFQ